MVMIIVLAIFSGVFIISERQDEKNSILENGQTFANFSAQSIYAQYVGFYVQPLPDDFVAFKSRVKSILDYNEDIKQVSLISVSGRILFDSEEFDKGKYAGPVRTIKDEATLAAVSGGTTTDRSFTNKDGQPLTEIVVPLVEPSGGHVLSMRYILGYESLGSRLIQVYQRVVAVGALLMLLVVITATLLAMRLTRPIVQLTEVAEQIRGGNLAARAKIVSQDETGRLAQTLNDMADRLREYYRDLEAKVSDRTRALQANVNRDDALLGSIGDGVIATDKNGTILLFNRASEEMLGLSAINVLSKPYDQVWGLETEKGEAVPPENNPMQKAIKNRVPVADSSFYYVRKDEKGAPQARFPVASTVSPVALNGEVIGMINVFRDITREKQVDRMKTEFISLASHQLRTPLSAIKWFTEMLLNGDAGKLTPEQLEFAKNVSDSTERMIALVNSLLNISRIESGRIIVEPKPTDLNELVQGIINDLKAKTEERQQTLVVSVHKDLPKINLDPRLIGQVYLNLLTNAIKYTPKGGEIAVFISRSGDEVVSQVTDNGYGIPKEEQAKLFGKFFRATNITKIETDGTGLGLYLVKAIIESSGGRIWFESEEGKGTTFWFSLPMSGMKAKEGEVTLDA
jgi:PAS domain S-box-containing protein